MVSIDYHMQSFEDKYNTTKLLFRHFDDCLKYDESGIVTKDSKFTINNPTFHIQNSKFIAKPEDKFETMLFLPEGEGRKGEGGLRTRGYFKFNYVTANSKSDSDSDGDTVWYIADFYGNPVIPAPSEIQKKIENYLNTVTLTSHSLQSLPLISIITVVYNGAKYLEETIQSVINQTYPNVEYIIIDGGSTDGTLDIIKQYEDYIDYWVSEKDKGIYDAMNKGIDTAVGKWIIFIGADDKFFNNFVLEGLLNYINNDDIDMICGCVKYENGKIVKSKYSLKTYLHNTIHHQATLYNKVLFSNFRYDTTFKIVSDYELNLYCFINNKKVLFNSSIICLCRSNGISLVKSKEAFIEMKKIRLKYFTKSKNQIYNILLDLKVFCHKLLNKFRAKKHV